MDATCESSGQRLYNHTDKTDLHNPALLLLFIDASWGAHVLGILNICSSDHRLEIWDGTHWWQLQLPLKKEIFQELMTCHQISVDFLSKRVDRTTPPRFVPVLVFRTSNGAPSLLWLIPSILLMAVLFFTFLPSFPALQSFSSGWSVLTCSSRPHCCL